VFRGHRKHDVFSMSRTDATLENNNLSGNETEIIKMLKILEDLSHRGRL